MAEGGICTFTVDSVGYHIYKDIWTLYVEEELFVRTEDENKHDRHAVAIIKDNSAVGHMPRSLLPVSWFLIKRGGTVNCEVTGHRKFGVGLEVPCVYTYKGTKKTIKKLRKLIST
jgi:hypothetical protein